MIAPYKIRWDGLISNELSPLDIITLLAFESDSGETETFLNRQAVISETYNGALKRGCTYKWSESMTPKLTIMKQDHSDFSPEENRRILKWLTGRPTAGYLDIYSNPTATGVDLYEDDMDIEYSLLGNFIEVNQYKLGNSRIVGYTATFETLTPYAFSALHNEIKAWDVTRYIEGQRANKLIINIDTDEPASAIYPKITIKQLGTIIPVDYQMVSDNQWIDNADWMDGTVYYYEARKEYYYAQHLTDGTIQPTTVQHNDLPTLETTSVVIKSALLDDNDLPITNTMTTLKLANNNGTETIVIDGANKVISRINRPSTDVIGNDFNWTWIPLYQGKNQIEIIGNCQVTIEYREVRKVGDY